MRDVQKKVKREYKQVEDKKLEVKDFEVEDRQLKFRELELQEVIIRRVIKLVRTSITSERDKTLVVKNKKGVQYVKL